MILQFIVGLLVISALLMGLMVLKTKIVWNKLIYLNLVNVKLAMALTVYGVLTDSQMVLDISMTYGLIGFLAAVTLTRFLLKGGHLK